MPLGFGGPVTCLGQFGARIEAFGLLSGRIGYAWDRTLFYVKGGGALAREKYVVNVPGAASVTPTDTRGGFLVGSGIEYGFAPRWSGKIEYNFIELGTTRLIVAGPGGGALLQDQSQQVHLLKFGLNYRL